MTDETFDERYVRYREHAELAKEFAELKATQPQILESLRRMETMLVARAPAPTMAPQETAAALALHRALDAFDKRPQTSGGANSILSHVGVLAIGAVGAWLLLGLNL